MKKTVVWLTCILLLAALLAGCGGQTPAQTTAPAQSTEESAPQESKEAEMTPEAKAAREAAAAVTSDSLYVKPVTGMPEDFILGMDVSSVLAEEKSGVRYYDAAGQEKTFSRSSRKMESPTSACASGTTPLTRKGAASAAATAISTRRRRSESAPRNTACP